MHAIWFSIIVPIVAAAVWIWPPLRKPKLLSALCAGAVLITLVWLATDLNEFVAQNGSVENIELRTLYLFLSETGRPFLQVTLGLLVAALYSWRFPSRA